MEGRGTFSRRLAEGFHLPAVAVYAFSYLLLRLLTQTYESYPDSSFWYPPAALNFSLLLLGGRRYVLLPLTMRVLGTALLSPETLLESFPYLLAFSVLEAVLALGLRRLTGPIPNLRNPAHLSLFLATAFVLPLLALFVTGGAHPPVFREPPDFELLRTLDTSMVLAVSMVIIVPFIIHAVLPALDLWGSVATAVPDRALARRLRRFALQVLLLAVATILVLVPGLWPGSTPYYLLVPPLVWVILAQGMGGAVAGIWFVGASMSVSSEILGLDITRDPMLNMAVILIATGALYFASFLEQKQAAQERARARDSRMKGVLDAAFDGILLLQDGRVLESNETMETMLGLAPGGLVGRSIYSFLRPDSARTLLALLAAPPPGVIERDLYLPGGQRLSLELCARPVQEEGHRLVVAAVRDISRRKAAEDALRESEEKYSRVFEMLGSAFASFSRPESSAGLGVAELRLTDHNRAFSQLLGPRGPAGGEMSPAIWQAEGLLGGFPWLGILTRAQDSPRPFQLEHRVGQTSSWYAVTAFSLGRGSVSLVLHDVSALRAAQSAMVERQTQLESLLANLPGMAYRCLNDQHWTMKFLSQGCLHLTGWKPEDLVDNRVLSYKDLILPEDRAMVVEAVTKALAEGRAFTMSYRIRDASGHEKWVWEQGALLRGPDGQAYLEGLIVDVSERVAAEKQRSLLELRMNETQRLESLGVLAGGVAHDFNNLLVSILANVDLLRLSLPVDEASTRRLQQLETAARRAADLTNQMLVYAGKGTGTRAPVLLPDLVDEMSELLQTVISKRARLSTSHQPDQGPVEADPSQLRQVVMNLLTNASDALGNQDGQISLRTGQVRLGAAQVEALRFSPGPVAGDYAFVEVQDDGCGMTEEQMARIFEPFFTTKFAGRGLGLAAVRGVVTAARGGLELDSRPLVGTRMRVYFPVAQGLREAPQERPQPQEPVAGAGRVILVVDDEEGVRRAASEILQFFGFKVLLARDGVEALEVFSDHSREISLVLLDLTMPRLGGVETLERLRLQAPDLPAIISSGYGHESQALAFDGRLVALPKPYNTQELLQAVTEVLSRAGQTDPR